MNSQQYVIKSIEQEHEMLSSYVKVHHRIPAIFDSYLERNEESRLIHSCHLAIKDVDSMAFVMLVTYTEYGVRLSCSRFESLISRRYPGWERKIRTFVNEHLRVGYFSRSVRFKHSRMLMTTRVLRKRSTKSEAYKAFSSSAAAVHFDFSKDNDTPKYIYCWVADAHDFLQNFVWLWVTSV